MVFDGRLSVQVVIPEAAGKGLETAARDLIESMVTIGGAGDSPNPSFGSVDSLEAGTEILVTVSEDEDEGLGIQGYRIDCSEQSDGSATLRIRARNETGAMYGVYKLIGDMGVRYYHPEETFHPENPEALLPCDYDDAIDSPSFMKRGFHEHTQHPIVWSDFLLKAGHQDWRDYVSNYLKWYARNRQNFLSFHMLKTVDLDSWLPYIKDIIDEAHAYGIAVSMFIGFVDGQQNGFKLIREDTLDPDTGEMLAEEIQIKQRLDTLMTAGFDQLGFQIGASEFTKPEDEKILEWIDLMLGYMADQYPQVNTYAWIHTTCDLLDDDGGYYYHLPLQSDPGLGTFVHTTMFYDMVHPAPVYSCEDFSQQEDFMRQANGQREQVYFPETAWWLGFDNSCPVVLPITGYTRQYDIQRILGDYDVSGHVAFTTGREWAYWQYDHYLTQATWDAELGWGDYLDWLSPVYGAQGSAISEVLKDWTALQKQNFFEDNPLIYFYLAGEMRQDEIGEMAGILARRPKLAFHKVLTFDDAEFATWQTDDLQLLLSMLDAYETLLEPLPDSLDEGSDQQKMLYKEIVTGLYVYTQRIAHAIALYKGVAAVRPWAREVDRAAAADPPLMPDEEIKRQAKEAAEGYLQEAEAISVSMISIFKEMEGLYRYPIDLLAREKDSLTSYPYGYLWETSTGHFWTRRDRQLEELIGINFGTLQEAWENTPAMLFKTDSDMLELVVPDDPLAKSVIVDFIPQILFGLSSRDTSAATPELIVALDYNLNLLPDAGSEQRIAGELKSDSWTGSSAAFPISVRDSAGTEMGELTVFNAVFQLDLTGEGETVSSMDSGTLSGEISSEALKALVMSVGGVDEELANTLIRGIFGIAASEPLPLRLPMTFSYTLEEAWLK